MPDPTQTQIIYSKTAAAMAQGRDDVRGRDVEITEVPGSSLPGDMYEIHTVGGLTATVSETQGKRPTQEDAYVVAAAGKRSPEEVPQFLLNTYDRIDEKARAAQVPDGATANTVYISADPDHTITIANAGDARTILLIRNVETGEIAATRLSYDHKASDPAEIARIEAAGGHVEADKHGAMRVRTNSGHSLAVARSIGDHDAPGVTHAPDITQVKVGKWVNDPNYEVYVVNSCDGLYEGMNETNLARLAQDYLGAGDVSNGPARSLAKLFTDAALYVGSRDNITATVAKLSPGQTQDVVISIFDGHGGSATSHLARDAMYAIASEPGAASAQSPSPDAIQADRRALVENVGKDFGDGREVPLARTNPGAFTDEELRGYQSALTSQGVDAKIFTSLTSGGAYLAVHPDNESHLSAALLNAQASSTSSALRANVNVSELPGLAAKSISGHPIVEQKKPATAQRRPPAASSACP